MSAFAIGASVATVAGVATGATITAMTPKAEDVGEGYFTRRDAQFVTALGIPAGIAVGFVGGVNGSSTAMIGASFLLGAAAGGFAGSLGANIAESRAAARR